jgi:2-oxoisovalerate dehydrogenase E1 component alpha subunit
MVYLPSLILYAMQINKLASKCTIGRRLYHRPVKTVHDLMVLEPPRDGIPMYQALSKEGHLMDSALDIPDEAECQRMMRSMLQTRVLDGILYDAQRQGRLSFYMTNTGEEAAQVGSAHALTPEDHIFGQYRETGVLLHRGFSITDVMDQCLGTCRDPGKGRQMPVHYGSCRLNFYPISSPLGTQLPHAAGLAYALELGHQPKTKMVMCYFGEGAASEGDFHGALNMASVLHCPVVYFCRNNGYAISTPTSEQYRGDGIASRGAGYGIKALRVDGNDALAVWHATRTARTLCLRDSLPVLLEALTYRVGHHSTSDDWTAYRDRQVFRREMTG